MALEAAFQELAARLDQLEQTLEDLLWAVIQGQPQTEPGHALVDHYDEAVSDLIGLVKEVKETATKGRQVAPDQFKLPIARQALITCQERYNQLLSNFWSNLVSFEWTDALTSLAGERGGEWAKWVHGVKDALGRCPPLLHNVSQALLPCWQDLLERANLLSISSQITNIGSQVYVDQEKVDEERGGI